MSEAPQATPQKIHRANELSGIIQKVIGEYKGVCPEPIDFFDILEALGLVGISELYKDAVLHPQPIFTDQQFKTAGKLVSDEITKALNSREVPLTPVVELIGVVTNMAHLARWHNEKIKAYLESTAASSEAAATSSLETE